MYAKHRDYLAKAGLTGVILLAAATLFVPGTLAVFSDQETNGANTFSAGTIDLTIAPASALVSFSNMNPGDSVTDDVVVSNAAGSSALRYAISSSATNADTSASRTS